MDFKVLSAELPYLELTIDDLEKFPRTHASLATAFICYIVWSAVCDNY
jgi:hypothetical protein